MYLDTRGHSTGARMYNCRDVDFSHWGSHVRAGGGAGCSRAGPPCRPPGLAAPSPPLPQLRIHSSIANWLPAACLGIWWLTLSSAQALLSCCSVSSQALQVLLDSLQLTALCSTSSALPSQQDSLSPPPVSSTGRGIFLGLSSDRLVPGLRKCFPHHPSFPGVTLLRRGLFSHMFLL